MVNGLAINQVLMVLSGYKYFLVWASRVAKL